MTYSTEPDDLDDVDDVDDVDDRDEQRLRLALAMIGAEAGRDDPVQDTAVRPVPVAAQQLALRQRRRKVRGGLLAAAASLAVGLLTVTLVNGGRAGNGDAGLSDDAKRGQTIQEGIACARMIAVGDIVAVRDAPAAGRLVVTFEVRDWIRPGHGAKRVEVDVRDTTDPGYSEPWKKGKNILIQVPTRRDLDAVTHRGAQLAPALAVIKHYLPQAEKTECRPYWRTEQPEANPDPSIPVW